MDAFDIMERGWRHQNRFDQIGSKFDFNLAQDKLMN